ncbi:MAG: DUF3047 domain-containing protein, partial [Noviherbaspirillum sp.]
LLLPSAAAETVPVGAFSAGDLAGWEDKSFKGHTVYALAPGPSGATVLQASTEGMASGRFRKIRVDLARTPVLNWSWKIEAPYRDIDEGSKGGDDFPVRVYVVVERGLLGLRTRAMNYVWASARPVGARWANPFTSQAMMLAVDSGAAKAGAWVSHKRNVREDLRAAFGEDVIEIHAVALMTDGDNGGRSARAWYGDIFFTSE